MFESDNESFSDSDQEVCTSRVVAKEKESSKLPNRHLTELCQKLGLDEFQKNETLRDRKTTETKIRTTENIPSTGSTPASQPTVVVFKDPSKHKKLKSNPKVSDTSETLSSIEKQKDFDIEPARHEVRQLVIRGTRSLEEKARAKEDLAVSLGAIRPKPKPVNYKVFKEMKKEKIKKVLELKKTEHIFTSKSEMLLKNKAVKKKNVNKVSGFESKFGKFSGSDARREIGKLKRQGKISKSSKK